MKIPFIIFISLLAVLTLYNPIRTYFKVFIKASLIHCNWTTVIYALIVLVRTVFCHMLLYLIVFQYFRTFVWTPELQTFKLVFVHPMNLIGPTHLKSTPLRASLSILHWTLVTKDDLTVLTLHWLYYQWSANNAHKLFHVFFGVHTQVSQVWLQVLYSTKYFGLRYHFNI